MSATTMSTIAVSAVPSRSTERFEPAHTKGVSHMMPLLLALALLAASAVVSVLISGPMH